MNESPLEPPKFRKPLRSYTLVELGIGCAVMAFISLLGAAAVILLNWLLAGTSG